MKPDKKIIDNAGSVEINGEDIKVWPDDIMIKSIASSILIVRFTDTDKYHDALKAGILENERSKRFIRDYQMGGCGIKIFNIDRWGIPEADLVHRRAMTLFGAMFHCKSPFCDVSMANIARDGEYCMPHSHIRTAASVVYSLTGNAPDPVNNRGGQLLFADPRLPECCQEEPGRMTTPLAPDMKPGTMLMFPGEVVHSVNPYSGSEPRITLAWNLHTEYVPGDPIRGGLPEK